MSVGESGNRSIGVIYCCSASDYSCITCSSCDQRLVAKPPSNGSSYCCREFYWALNHLPSPAIWMPWDLAKAIILRRSIGCTPAPSASTPLLSVAAWSRKWKTRRTYDCPAVKVSREYLKRPFYVLHGLPIGGIVNEKSAFQILSRQSDWRALSRLGMKNSAIFSFVNSVVFTE